jgi:hypothetical protein
MAVRRFAAAALLLSSSSVLAQTFPKPTDVPDYVSVTPVYETTSADNVSLDPATSTPSVGELTDIPTSQTGRIVTGTFGNATGFCLTTADGGTCQQAKFRITLNTSHIGRNDPVRNFCQPGATHLHQFFGNAGVGACSTYSSLRLARKGTFSNGDELNATGYWFPCSVISNPFGDSKNYCVKANWITLYYTMDPVLAKTGVRLYRGLRYVTGYRMGDPAWTDLQSAIDTANTAYGSTRYVQVSALSKADYPQQPIWKCSGATVVTPAAQTSDPAASKWLKNADGTDPFGGTCVSGADMWVQLSGASCWSGAALWSPGGYDHVIPQIWDSVKSKLVCPKNYYRIPSLELEVHYSQQGFADYGRWRLESDDAEQTRTGTTVNNGYTWHADWMNGWDGATLQEWLFNCLGVEHHTPHECNGGVFSSTKQLSNGRVSVSHNYTTDNAANMFQVPASSHGPGNIDMTPQH